MSDTNPIPYTLGFSVTEHPLSDGESIRVAFRSTVARITRNGADDYQLETSAPMDTANPYRGALHGSYANFAVARTLLGCQYSEAAKETHEKCNHLSADELDRCMADIARIHVNQHDGHGNGDAHETPTLTVSDASVAEKTATSERTAHESRYGMFDAADFLAGNTDGPFAERVKAHLGHIGKHAPAVGKA